MNKNEIIEGIKEHGLNFVANNYWKMEKEQLKEICLAYMNATKVASTNSVANFENVIAFEDLQMFLD